MEIKNKALWRNIAAGGSAIMTVTFAISIVQYFAYKQYDPLLIVRYDSLFMSTELLVCFIYMMFNPLNFRVYAVGFYLFGLGNLIDNGNLLAMMFLIASAVFFHTTGFFRKRRLLKCALLLVPVAASLCLQCHRLGSVNFIISLMHIVAGSFILMMMAALVAPELERLQSMGKVMHLDGAQFSEADAAWLNAVLHGEPYGAIAKEAGVSESTVKARMLRLYKTLGAKNRTEFCAMYRNTQIAVSPPESD